jgi:hypothetical protein
MQNNTQSQMQNLGKLAAALLLALTVHIVYAQCQFCGDSQVVTVHNGSGCSCDGVPTCIDFDEQEMCFWTTATVRVDCDCDDPNVTLRIDPDVCESHPETCYN